MQTKEKLHDVDLSIAMWFYDACIPLNACNSPYFQNMVDKIAGIGHGYKELNYHALRVNLLKDAKKSVSLLIDSYRSNWIESGCTIMSDGWRDISQRHLINFFVYCPKGVSFLKSVDASSIESNASNLCNMFAKIVEMVGEKNMIQTMLLITNLLDVSELENVKILVTLASKVTVFVYNHKWPLNWLRQRQGWTEIIRPGATRFGTTFIALNNLHDHKDDLQAMVISPDFKKMLKVKNAIDLKVMTPLLRFLRLCDSNEKSALGYIYDGMHREMKGVKELFKRKKELYEYDRENLCRKVEVFQEILDLTLALGKFRDSVGTFGRSSAIASRTSIFSDERWKLFSGDCPKLQMFAIIILSQTASSSGCERNWSVFERIYMKKRNRFELQRLNDIVFVHYNLRLQNRMKVDKMPYDPIDNECIDKTEFWVVEEEMDGELSYDDIEDMIEEQETATQPQENESDYRLVDEDGDGDDHEFRLLNNRELDAYNTPMSQYP